MLKENEQPGLFEISSPEIDDFSRELHEEGIRSAKLYIGAESRLIQSILKIDQNKTYLKYKEVFLTPYCEKFFGLSHQVAGYLVTIVRKSQKIPELLDAVKEGVPASKLKPIMSVVTPQNQAEWIQKVKDLPKHQLEKAVAIANPKPKKPEKAKATGENRTRLEFELSDKDMELQNRAKDLVSRKIGHTASLAEVQSELLEEYLKRNDPVKKAERSLNRKTQQESPQGGSTKARHEATLRDQGKCQAKLKDGSICGQTRWVDLHHKIPRSKGGKDTKENLITLCSGHHRMWHRHH